MCGSTHGRVILHASFLEPVFNQFQSEPIINPKKMGGKNVSIILNTHVYFRQLQTYSENSMIFEQNAIESLEESQKWFSLNNFFKTGT